MKLLLRLFALFIILPAVELALLVQVDALVGFWSTVGLILTTGFVGGYMAKREGMSVWRRFNERIAKGGLPDKEIVDGVIILIAGALLITPGVLTDLFGLLGLLPFTRAVIRRIALKRIKQAMQQKRMVFNVHGNWPTPQAPVEDPQESTSQWQGRPTDLPRYVDRSEET